MDLVSAGLRDQPFRAHGKPIAFVQYSAVNAALEALHDMLECRHGLTLLQGPPLSGKTTLLRHFASGLGNRCSIAVLDGSGLNTTNLLSQTLSQFGYDFESGSTSELLAMLRVFCMQQTASQEPPLLILENVHELAPSALRALSELAGFRVRHNAALRIVLSSNRSLQTLLNADVLEPVSRRVSNDIHLRPMNSVETRDYLYGKLKAAGCETPNDIIPDHLCNELWQASGGWPGVLDRITLLAMAKSATLPLSITTIERPALPYGTWDDRPDPTTEKVEPKAPETARLVLSLDGKVVSEKELASERLLIGRSDHNDLFIDSRFISRHHAMFVRHGTTTFLMDLNSTNGTFVNSRRVSNHILMHNDVVSLGNHRIKFYDPAAQTAQDAPDLSDTAIMRSLQDMRELLAKENTALLPAQDSEQLPTYIPQS